MPSRPRPTNRPTSPASPPGSAHRPITASRAAADRACHPEGRPGAAAGGAVSVPGVPRLSGTFQALKGGGTLHRFSQSDRPLDADELPHFGDHRLVRVQLDPQQGADPSCVWARAGRHQPFAFVSLSGGGAWSSSASLTAADASDDCGRRCRNLWLVNARPPLTLTRRSLADSTSHTHYCCRTLHRMTRF